MRLVDTPAGFAIFAFVVMWLAAHLGIRLHRLRLKTTTAARSEFRLVVGAALTLLGLLIGFSFSMGVNRYDQRKDYEAEEANAIGTEYLRVTLLPSADATRARALLKSYLDQRLLFYTMRDDQQLEQIATATMRLQNELWSTVQHAATAAPSALTSLVAAGMNDVLNRQAYTQAAWWNRIPRSAWTLMIVIGIVCNLLVGFSVEDPSARAPVFFILPAIVAISLFLIADMDSPRRGVIRVIPMNLLSLSQSLPP
jgi:MFS family permease